MYDDYGRKTGGNGMPNGMKMALYGVGALVAVMFLVILSPFTIVDPQEAAVVTRLGSMNRVLNSGLAFKIPLIESVNKVEIAVQTVPLEELVYSKDAQTVTVQANAAYKVDASQVEGIFRDTRFDHEGKWINPAVKDALRAVLARYTAQGIIENRGVIPNEVKEQFNIALQERGAFGIIVDGISITNIDLDDAYEAAVLAKQVAEQRALEQANITDQEEEKKKQTILQSEALAERTRLEAVALQSSQGDKVIAKIYAEAALEAAKRWNGSMPQWITSGAAMPWINIPAPQGN